MVVPVRPEVQEKYVSFAQFGEVISAVIFLWWQVSWQWNVDVSYLLNSGSKTGSKDQPG